MGASAEVPHHAEQVPASGRRSLVCAQLHIAAKAGYQPMRLLSPVEIPLTLRGQAADGCGDQPAAINAVSDAHPRSRVHRAPNIDLGNEQIRNPCQPCDSRIGRVEIDADDL